MATFEDFYKAVKQIIDEDQEDTEEFKQEYLKGVEAAKPYIDVINKKDEELGLTKEEGYVLSYLVEHAPEEGRPKTAYDFTLLQLVSMMYVHDKKDIVIQLYNDEAARLALVQSITGADLEEIKLDRNDDKVAGLLKSKQPTLDDLLDVIGFGNVIHIYEKHAPKYRTRARAKEQGAITEMPKNMPIPTFSKYQYSMSLYPEGGAYLQPLSSTDGLVFKSGKLFFDKIRRPDLEAELQNLKTKEGINYIDLPVLHILYGIILTQFENSGYKELADVIKIHISTLAEYMGMPSNLNKRDVNRVLEKIQSYHNIVGVIHGTRNGKPTQSYYQVLNFESYNDKTNVVTFSSPYMNYVIKTVYNLSIRKTKDGKQKLKKNGEPLRLPTHSYLIDSSIAKERNKAAVVNVEILVALIEQAGDNIPRIKASTLIERNVQLADRLEAAANPRSLLDRTFKKTWELLRTKTRLQEAYKDIELPEPGDPAFMPTMKTLDKVVFTFPHKGKK